MKTKPNPFDELTALFKVLPLDRKEALLEEFQEIVDEEKEHEEESTLAQAWDEIQYNLDYLRHEPYIDDQVEIDEIWNICDTLAEEGLEDESPQLRMEILREVLENDCYSELGLDDPFDTLVKALCVTAEEKAYAAKHGY